MSNKKYWCAFSKLTKTSHAFTNLLYQHFGSIELAWHAQPYDLWKIEGIRKSSIESFIQERNNVNPDECLEYIEKRGITFLCPEDDDYPEALRYIDEQPAGLFVLGDLKNCNLQRTLAVVGSRKASENSKNTLRKILSGFHDTDICIVSGLAEGIDTVAHKSAVDNNMKTIAIIGGGFDKLYPKSNEKLFNQIKDGAGAIISEYWVDVDAISWHFPLRNRLVSGISKGVLVAEAAIKSGAMITAKLALEQGKELMCMPGLISNPNTEGIYKLLKTGAAIVTNHNDILDAMGWKIDIQKTDKMPADTNFTDDEKKIIDCIKKDMLTLDEIILKTDLNINDLMVLLTKLELDGTIKRTDGEKYISLI